MTITPSLIIGIGAGLMLLSIIFTKLGNRLKAPTLLIFLAAGMLFGEDGWGIQFSNMELAQTIGMIALCVILFTGGMETSLSEIKSVLAQGITLSTLGVLLTTVFTGLFIYYTAILIGKVENVSLAFCLLLAATMSSTDSASVFNILRSQNIGLRHHARPMLELESGSNDPMAYMLTLALIEVCQEPGAFSAWAIGGKLIIQFVVGGVLGFLLGKAAIWFINKINLDNTSLYPIILLCVIFVTFATTELCRGNGYLAVYLAGMLVGNKRLVKKRDCTKFLDGMTWLLQIIMFLSLGLLVTPHEMLNAKFILVVVSIGLFMMLVARPLAVILSFLPFCRRPHFNKGTLGFVSWVGLRGATPIIFATYPVVANVPGCEMIFNVVFAITIMSLLLQGTTIPLTARIFDMMRDIKEEGNSFGAELPEMMEEMDHKLYDLVITEDMLADGNQLKSMKIFSENERAIMIRRETKNGPEFLSPNGTMKILPGDTFLCLSCPENPEKEKELQQ